MLITINENRIQTESIPVRVFRRLIRFSVLLEEVKAKLQSFRLAGTYRVRWSVSLTRNDNIREYEMEIANEENSDNNCEKP